MLAHILDVLPAFLVASVILAALPGPATVLFLHRSVRDGRTAGLAAVVGNEIGIFGWTLAGGAGLSMLLTANKMLSLALHVVGAAVLVWLGISAWRSAKHPADVEVPLPPRGRTPAAAFRAALVSIAANPKAAAVPCCPPCWRWRSSNWWWTPRGASASSWPLTGHETSWAASTSVAASNA
jgi:threonine/homoserine/homoserine lactone efflux protein